MEKGKGKQIEPTTEVGESSQGSNQERENLIFGNVKWGDLDFSSSEQEEEAGSGSEEDVEVGDFKPAIVAVEGELEKMSKIGVSPCLCFNISSPKEAVKCLNYLLGQTPSTETMYCILDNIISCYNIIFENHEDPYSEYRIAFADNFYRIRHEMLYKTMCLMINISPDKSDTKFSEFGIDSERTPDRIIQRDDSILILEVTAVSSFEKAASSKGMDQMGFESKYKKEIDLLRDKYENVIYLPLFFNMSDLYNPIQKEQLAELSELFTINRTFLGLLQQMSRGFSNLSISFKPQLGLPSAILFNDRTEVLPNHPNHEFLYSNSSNKNKTRYKEITVSNPVYKKMNDMWDRLGGMAERKGYQENQKMRIVFDSSSHRLNIERDRNGLDLKQLDDSIKRFDRITVFKNTYVKTGKIVVRCIDSDTGIKLLEPTYGRSELKWERVEYMASHLRKNPIKFSNVSLDIYSKLSKSFSSGEIGCRYYDPEYENVILDSIKNFDIKAGELGDNDGYMKLNVGMKLLGQMHINPEVVSESLNKIRPSYVRQNTEGDEIPRTILKCKSPFVIPIGEFNNTSYCKLDFKNDFFIDKVMECTKNTNLYTYNILSKVLEEKYKMYTEKKVLSDSMQSLINQRMSLSNEMNMLFKKCKKDNPGFKKIKDSVGKDKENYLNIVSKANLVNREIKNREKTEGTGKDISYIRLPTKNNSDMYRSYYKSEMEHFKNKKIQSTIEGVGLLNGINQDYKKDYEIFKNLNLMLMEYRGENPDKLYDNYVSEDSRLLQDLKHATVENYREIKEYFENSALGHACSFISRLAHSLMFYSQQSFSSDYVRVDNLGYNGVLLIVKGGKKIFKSKASKLFRLVLPINKNLMHWYFPNHSNKGSTLSFKYGDLDYIITPWAYWHENTLSDCISFYQRVGSFTILNSNPKMPLNEQFHKIQLNVLLAFHNRRQTEVLLANLRYILLSTMGEYTGLQDILSEFFGFNYDCFQSFIRNSIIINYQSYFNSIYEIRRSSMDREISEGNLKSSNLKNIFTGNRIKSVEELALMIYSTFLMTKAPYQKLIERANNLKGILKIHDQYINDVGDNKTPEEQLMALNVECKGDFIEYSENLFKNDFKFDAKYCSLIGNFMDSYFLNNFERDMFHSEWIRVQNSNWDEMATSTGLRGDYETIEDFWGQKGYFVVYKSLLKNEEFKSSIEFLLSDSITDSEKRKILRGMNKIYKESNPTNEFLIFHAVDKSQWRGNREIYVMDIHTKILQQPIEKFMGFVCSKMDNELISIPSNKRAQVIHHSIFEKDVPLREMLTWYLTLDCSKWAPKSIFAKFSICINNMECIPNSFKIHLLNYFERLYKKRLYFNSSEVEVLNKNPQYKDVCERYLIFDEKVKGYYLNANYSWVMGIFNYMSSFLHAANQKYFSYILTTSTRNQFQEDCQINMFAHSDDSGGKITTSSPALLRRALILYEINLHAANHLLSKKKSVVSKIYFEILSIIYLFKKLLALLPKFLGGLRFLPTDKGPAQDLLQSYSKCIEVIVAGADFSISYIVLKIMSYLIYRFYFNKSPKPIDYYRPVQYVGMPDSHPIMCLLCGTDSDLLRLSRTKSGENRLIEQMAFTNCIIENKDGEGPIKPLKFAINIKNLSKDFGVWMEEFKSGLDSWSIKNVNYHSTGMNTLSFLAKLKDPGFVGSLVNESQVRRISRSYHHRSSRSLITNFGYIRLETFVEGIKMYTEVSNDMSPVKSLFSDVLTEEGLSRLVNSVTLNKDRSLLQLEIFHRTMKSPIKLLKYFDKMSLEGRNLLPSNRTLKPALVQLNKGGQIFSMDFDPASLVSYIKEPDLRWALPNLKNINTARIELERYLDSLNKKIEDMPADLLMRICRSFGRDNVKNIYIYSRTPSDMRQIKNYTSFLTFLSVNSFANTEIEGLSINMTDRDSSREYITSSISETFYFINNLINILHLFQRKCGTDFMNKISYNEIDEINFPGGKINELMDCIGGCLMDSPEGSTCLLPYYLLKSIMNDMRYNITDYRMCAYYTFLKEQKIKTGWYGSGEVYINICNNFYSFKLKNNNAVELVSNKTGKLDQMHEKFILDVFENIGITLPKNKPKFTDLRKNTFGYDLTGGLGIFSSREVIRGVPAIFRESIGSFSLNLENCNIIRVQKDFVVFKNMELGTTHKVYHLPLKKFELVDIIRILFKKEDFNDKMLTEGLSDFEDYVMTEIMPEYGAELYIGFDQFIDNYSASRTFEIFKRCSELGLTKFKTEIEYSLIPAQEGSFTRILIDYSNHEEDKVIKVFNRIDPDVMRMRSEYPEQVSVILQEKLQENYYNLYTPREIKEVTDSYMKILSIADIDKKRAELIKLMCYWGYSSLVNNIETFRLIRNPDNYTYFNLENCFKNNKIIYSNMYPSLIGSIVSLISDFESKLDEGSYPVKELLLIKPSQITKNYIKTICANSYNSKFIMACDTLLNMGFNNIFLNLMLDEDFVTQMQALFSKNLQLSCLPVSSKLRVEVLTTINLLQYVWFQCNNTKFSLNFSVINQRIPPDIPTIPSKAKSFGVSLKPSQIYYHGFLNSSILDWITTNKTILVKGDKYHITNKLKKLSKNKVQLNKIALPERPMLLEALESEDFDELTAELGFHPIDEDTVLEYWENINPKYQKKKTKSRREGGNMIVYAEISWIVAPYEWNKGDVIDHIRQCGENLVLLTDTYMPALLELPYSGVRALQVGEMEMPILAFFYFQKELYNQEFINQLLGRHQFNYTLEQKKKLHTNKIRDVDGVLKGTLNLGKKIGAEIMSGEHKFIKDEAKGVISLERSEERKENTPTDITKKDSTDPKDDKLKTINTLIKKMKEELNLDQSTVDRIRDKYMELNRGNFSLENIYKSAMAEFDLLSIRNSIQSGDLSLTKSQRSNMMANPKVFSGVSSGGTGMNNPVKDRKLRSEIDSLMDNASTLIASGALTISSNMQKLIKSNFKLWYSYMKLSSYKKEQKTFLLQIVIAKTRSALPSVDDEHDYHWQDFINKVTNYLTQDSPAEDDELSELFSSLFLGESNARIKYKAKGVPKL
jgi:hypothetical protein